MKFEFHEKTITTFVTGWINLASKSRMEQQSDTQLINRILAGEVREYAVLVNRHKDLAFTIAFRILNNREDSEEVVQDAFVKIYRGLSGFRQDAKFSTWLFRIVYNAAISKRRVKSPVFNQLMSCQQCMLFPDLLNRIILLMKKEVPFLKRLC